MGTGTGAEEKVGVGDKVDTLSLASYSVFKGSYLGEGDIYMYMYA